MVCINSGWKHKTRIAAGIPVVEHNGLIDIAIVILRSLAVFTVVVNYVLVDRYTITPGAANNVHW